MCIIRTNDTPSSTNQLTVISYQATKVQATKYHWNGIGNSNHFSTVKINCIKLKCSLQCNRCPNPIRMIPFRKAYCMKWTMKRKLCLLKALVKISWACSSFYCHYTIILWILPTKRHKIKWMVCSAFVYKYENSMRRRI